MNFTIKYFMQKIFFIPLLMFFAFIFLSGKGAWKTIDQSEYFTVKVPSYMSLSYGLNEEATVEYQYVEEIGGEVKEMYLIVLFETKEEIESYNLETEFNALSYAELSAAQLGEGLDSYEILTTEPKVVEINGMDCVKYVMRGSMGDVDVYYKLAVYEGKKAFYQVLTWTLASQISQFNADMETIISSLKEKK